MCCCNFIPSKNIEALDDANHHYMFLCSYINIFQLPFCRTTIQLLMKLTKKALRSEFSSCFLWFMQGFCDSDADGKACSLDKQVNEGMAILKQQTMLADLNEES
jgi:hypothetical protein